MKDINELLTTGVIFLTAIIGLYKVVKNSNDSGSIKPSDESTGISGYFKPLLSLIGLFGFMLMFPLFVYLFLTITHAITPSDNKSDLKEDTKVYQVIKKDELSFKDLSNDEKDCYLLFVAAMNVSNIDKRDILLENTINYSIKLKSYNIASLAAQNITNANKKDKMLDIIIQNSLKDGSIDIAVDLLPIYSSANIKDNTAALITTEIQNRMKTNTSIAPLE